MVINRSYTDKKNVGYVFSKNVDVSIYISLKENIKKEEQYDIVKELSNKYCSKMNIGNFDYKKINILREDKGKPYYEEGNLHFSLSHTGNFWALAIAPYNIGLDIQQVGKNNYKKISKRFYTKEEQLYVEEFGIEGFYNLWTRKEAFGKLTGDGFFGSLPNFVENRVMTSKIFFNVAIYNIFSNKLEEVICKSEDVFFALSAREHRITGWNYEYI